MSASTVMFYILGALVLTFGILTVFSRKIFRAAVFLLLSLIGIAGIYIIMEMEFIAALQIVIYVGGIVVLIIFSIFLTHQSGQKLPARLPKHILWSVIVAGIGLLLSTHVLFYHKYVASTLPAIPHTVKNIGTQLIDYREYGYVFPFEVVSVLLLSAMIGSIVIAIKTKKN